MKRISLSVSGIGLSVEEAQTLARRAEESRFEAVWTADFSRSAFVMAAALAAATRTIRIGTGIALAFVRSPLVTALEAQDADDLSGGRLILGLGPGVKRLNERWHGIAYDKPVPRIRECVELVRKIWDPEAAPVRHEGRFYKIDLTGFDRITRPLRTRIPIYIAGVRERMVQAAGMVADGLLGHPLYSPRYIETVRANLEKGAAKAGRKASDVDLVSYLLCAVSDHADEARADVRNQIAFYATVRTYTPIFELHGFGENARTIQQAFRAGDIPKIIQSVTNEMIDAFAIAGTPDECRERLSRYDGLLDMAILQPPTNFLPQERIRAYHESIIEAFGQ